jgi:hypothetical protein
MQLKKKINYMLITGFIATMVIAGYNAQRRQLLLDRNGVYRIAKIENIKIARGG